MTSTSMLKCIKPISTIIEAGSFVNAESVDVIRQPLLSGGVVMVSELDKEIQAHLVNGKLPCAIAFLIAQKFKVNPKEVGEACNRLQIKVRSCQLGCFP